MLQLENYSRFPNYVIENEIIKTELSVNDQTVLKVGEAFYSGDNTFYCKIKGDPIVGIDHIGLWLYNREENFWIVFAYPGNNQKFVNIWKLEGNNPRNTSKSFTQITSISLASTYDIRTFKDFKIEIKNSRVKFYLESVFLYEMGFRPLDYCFGIFSFASKLEAKDLLLQNSNFVIKEYPFYRVLDIRTNTTETNPAGINAAELKFLNSSLENKSVGGNPLTSSSDPEYPHTNAFDSNINTSWHVDWKPLNININNYLYQYIGYSFNESFLLRYISYAPGFPGTNSRQEWLIARVEASQDGITWGYYGAIKPNRAVGDTGPKIAPLTYPLNSNINFQNSFRFWRLNNIVNRDPAYLYKTIKNLKFYTKEIPTYPYKSTSAFSSSSLSLEYTADKAFNNTSESFASSSLLTEATSEWFIGYDFEENVILNKLDLGMKTAEASLGSEWTSFNIEVSSDGIFWVTLYSINNPKLFKNDPEIHTYSLREVEGIFKYDPPVNTDPDLVNKHRFWRLSNLDYNIKSARTSASLLSISLFKFLSSTEIQALDYSNLGNSFSEFGYDPGFAFDLSESTKAYSVNHFIKFKDFSVGFLFDNPVDIDGSFYRYNANVDFSNLTSANLEYSDNGFDWNLKGYFDYSKTSENSEYLLLTADLLSPKFKFWRLRDFVAQENYSLNYNANSSISGIRFNTLGGASSNSPSDSNPNAFLFYKDLILGENRSFSSAISLTLNSKYAGDLKVVGQNDYYTFNLTIPSDIRIYSESGMDTYGYLYGSNQQLITANDDSGGGAQFLMTALLQPGTYYVMVRHYSSGTGKYAVIVQTGTSVVVTPPWVVSFLGGASSVSTSLIYYEFNTPEYLKNVYLTTQKSILYATVEASSDGLAWYKKGYINFNNFISNNSVNHYSLNIEQTNFFDMFNSLDFTSFKNYPLNSKVSRPDFKEDLIETSNKYINIYTLDNVGTIEGEVTELDVPVIRQVGLYDRLTRKLVAITWSNELGKYKFVGVDSTRKYYVHAIDSNDFYNAVTQDMIEPLI